ncbi:MAG: hypothetical protein CL999_005335 [Methanobacteriota archaeon]|nr:MAG: hypothetical protein CL999_005335 [Euryarchaeota archaeon]
MKSCYAKSIKFGIVRASPMQDAFSMLSDATGLNGTGVPKPVPLFYRALMASLPPVVRSLTNVRYMGLDRLPRNGPVILAGNHTSHIDPIVVIMGARIPVRYLAKTEHFNGGFTKFVMISTGQIDTNRESGGTEALSSAVDVLSDDGWMGIFPEGTRSRHTSPPFLQKGKTGIARLAAKFPHASVVPICIRGARRFMEPGKARIRLFTPIEVEFGVPITFSQWLTSPGGFNLTEAEIFQIFDSKTEKIQLTMGKMYRSFTDQLMSTLKNMGAP